MCRTVFLVALGLRTILIGTPQLKMCVRGYDALWDTRSTMLLGKEMKTHVQCTRTQWSWVPRRGSFLGLKKTSCIWPGLEGPRYGGFAAKMRFKQMKACEKIWPRFLRDMAGLLVKHGDGVGQVVRRQRSTLMTSWCFWLVQREYESSLFFLVFYG